MKEICVEGGKGGKIGKLKNSFHKKEEPLKKKDLF